MHVRKALLIFIVMTSAITASAQGVQSIYTDINQKTCKTLEEDNNPGGFMREECQGLAGYKLEVFSSDRSYVEIISPDGTKHDLHLGYIGGGGFSGLNNRAEWRVKRERGKIVPIALILRYEVSTNPSTPEKTTSYLVVSKITPREVCRVGEVDPGPNQNQKARLMADASASKPCFKPPNEEQ